MPPSDVARLPNLPAELLVEIVNQLDDESLIQLSMTCRKFHFLALPVVFTRAKLINTRCLYLQQSPANLLRALRIALFVDHATSFVVGLNHDRDRLLPEVHSFNRLVSRMSSTEKFTFFMPLLTFAINNDGIFDRWTREVIRLFDIVLSKQCYYFFVGGDMVSASFEPIGAPSTNTSSPRATLLRHPIVKKISGRLRNLPKSAKRTILSIIPQRSSRQGGSPHPTVLQYFHAFSSTLFQPQFLDWTTSTLQTNSQTLLEVSFQTNRIPASTWHDLLSKLTLPSLSKFRLTCNRVMERQTINFNDVVKFLTRHPSIVGLDLYGPAPRNNHRPRNLLPALETLTSPPELTVWLLDCKYPCKQLKSLNIVSEVYRGPAAFDYDTFDEVLDLLPHCTPSLTTLTLSFFSGPGAIQWLDKHASRGHDGTPSGPLAALEGITTLKLELSRSWEKEVTGVIPRFVVQFPGLQHLIYPELPPDLAMEPAKRMFLKEIALMCPGMKTVSIGYPPVNLDSLSAS